VGARLHAGRNRSRGGVGRRRAQPIVLNVLPLATVFLEWLA